MKVQHIDNKNSGLIGEYVNDDKHVFVLIYMDGCGPCNATKPEWFKMSSALSKQYPQHDNVAIIDVEQSLMPEIKEYVGSADGFPTMKYISEKGKKVETYENSGIKKTDRSADSFINWVESKITDTVSHDKSSAHSVAKRIKSHSKKTSTQKGGSKSKSKNRRMKNSKIKTKRMKNKRPKPKRKNSRKANIIICNSS